MGAETSTTNLNCNYVTYVWGQLAQVGGHMGTQHQNKHNPHAQETPAPLKDTMVSKTNSQMKGQKKKKANKIFTLG